MSDEDTDREPQFSMRIDVPDDVSDSEFETISVISSTAAATMAIARTQRRIVPVPDDLTTMAALLNSRSKTNGTGEEMLQTQAITLDLVFNQLLSRAMDQTDLVVSDQL